MERKDSEASQWPFMANPTLQNNQHPLRINGSHSNPNFRKNHYLFQNPNSSQRYLIYPQTQTLPRSFEQPQEELEGCFSRMNLNMCCNNNNDHSPVTDSNVDHLQQMRIQSAVRGQMGLYGGHANSTGSLGSQGLVGQAMTGSANLVTTSIGNGFDNVFNLQRRSQSLDELAYASSSARRAPGLQWGNTNTNPWAVNGLESQNSSSHPLIYYPQQRSKYSSLKELRGQVSSVAKDQLGCRLLQKKFDNEVIKREEIEMIFSEVKDQLHELMVHQFANYLIQKLFEAGNQELRTQLLLLLVRKEQKFVDVCTDAHGTRAVQKFIERISTQEQKTIILSVLMKPVTLTLTKDNHGHHIIQQCLNKFSNEDTKHLVGEIVKHCLEIATDKSGCCVLQQCLSLAKAEDKEHLLAEITTNALVLSENPFGNYVVQYVIREMNQPHVTSNIIVQLGGCYSSLSMSKYGSNVVERCLNHAGEEFRARIIAEIMHDPDFLKVLQDPYGNYVVQSALHVSKGDLHNALVAFIQHHYPFLHSHPFGNKVLARTKWRKNRV
ncbi:hypothetical protein PTKIN_Ptkin10aG0125100 [Pterospermum kingtungense]